MTGRRPSDAGWRYRVFWRRIGTLAWALTMIVSASPAAAQWYRPQSDRDLRVTWDAQRIGPSRVVILGTLQNLSDNACRDVILRAEGLDRAGRVVSRARTQVRGEVPPFEASGFEIRLVLAGSERRYRVTVESFEFVDAAEAPLDAP